MMKHFFRVAALLSVVVILLSALSFKTERAQASTSSGSIGQNQFSSTSCGKWSVVPSPNGNGESGLSAVAVLSANKIWAVGNVGDPVTRVQTTLIEFWDGTQWQIVPSPNPSLTHNTLYGVTAISARDVWAVGFYANASDVSQTLIEHWNGSSWSVVDSPNPGAVNNELFSVAAISARNIWAVGFTTNSNFEQTTLIEHWNGVRWSVVSSPSPSTTDVLNSVTALSATDVWAVGNSNGFGQTLIEHWNGVRWSMVPSPNPGSSNSLSAVSAASTNNVWAVGYSSDGNTIQRLVERWDGIHWDLVKVSQSGTRPTLSGVAALSANNVWIVGSEGSSSAFFQTLIEHWNGSGLHTVPSPSPGSFSTQLLGVAAVSTNDVWAVGYADSNTLVEHYQACLF